jgi:DNA-binding MarR family transcriptional regulator
MDLDEQVAAICAAYPRVYERFYRRLPAGGYKPGPESLAVLRHLHASGPLTVREAQAHFARSQASVSELFARLEERGLLTRLRDERDRRRTLVWLSEAGKECLAQAESVLDPELLRPVLARMDESLRRGLARGMQALTDR